MNKVRRIADAGWSSQVARRAHNPKVGGSNPPPATKKIKGSGENPSPFLSTFGTVPTRIPNRQDEQPLGVSI